MVIMSVDRIWRVALSAVLCVLAAETSATAGVVLTESQDTFVEMGFQLQAVSQNSKNQAGVMAGKPTVSGDQYDTYLREGRVSVSGQITPMTNFYIQLANDNAGKNYSASTATNVLDSWVQLNLSPASKFLVGIFPVQFSRSRLSTTATTVSLERPFIDEFQLDSGGLAQKRDRGLLLWGTYSGFQYRVAAGNGAAPSPQMAGGQSMRIHGRTQMSFGVPEEDFRLKEGYLGERNVFSIGYGFDKQDNASLDVSGAPTNYSAWTADAFLEGKSNSGATTLSYAYYSYDWGNPDKTDSTGNYVQGQGWQLLLAQAVLEQGSGVQPYTRYGVWSANSTAPGSSQNRLATGMNFLLKGKNVKLGFEYEQVKFPVEGATWDKRNYDKYGIQYQIVF
jgi:hypothetical protein